MTYSLEQTHVRRLALDVVLEGPAVGRLLGEVKVLARDGVGMHLALAVADLGVDDRVGHVHIILPELARHGLRETFLPALAAAKALVNGMPRSDAVAPVTMMLPPPCSTIAGVQHWAHVNNP